MKPKKWLIIIVVLLLILNGLYYFGNKLLKVDSFIKKRLTSSLSARTASKVNINSFDFNDKVINIYGLTLESTLFDLKIEQVHINYNIFYILFVSIMPTKAINSVDIYSPDIKLKYSLKKNKTDLRTEFEKILKKITKTINFNIIDAKIELQISKDDQFSLMQIFENVQISLKKEGAKNSKIDLSLDVDTSPLTLFMSIKNATIDSLKISSEEFFLPNLKITGIDSLNYRLSLDIAYKKGFFKTETFVDSLYLTAGILKTYSKSISFLGSSNLLKFTAESLQILDVPFEINGSISDVLTKNINIQADILVADKQKIDDIFIVRNKEEKGSVWHLKRAFWSGNSFSGNLSKSDGKIAFELREDNFNLKKENFKFTGKLFIDGGFENNLFFAKGHFDSLFIETKNFTLENYVAQGSLQNFNSLITVSNRAKDLQFNAKGDILKKSFDIHLVSENFSINELLKTKAKLLPTLFVDLKGKYENSLLKTQANLEIRDRYFSMVNGSFNSEFDYDFSKGKLDLSLDSDVSTFNNYPFDLSLLATGNFDSLRIDSCLVNDVLQIHSTVLKRNQEYVLKGKISGEKLLLNKWFPYIGTVQNSVLVKGKANLDILFDYEKNISANLELNKIIYNGFGKVEAGIKLKGKINSMCMDTAFIRYDSTNIILAKGYLGLDSGVIINSQVDIANLNLSDLTLEEEKKYTGILNGKFIVNYSKDDSKFDLKLNCLNSSYKNFVFDRIEANILQKEKFVKVNSLNFYSKGQNIYLEGELGYNLLKSTIYPSGKLLKFYYEGDFLELLSKGYPLFEDQSSKSQLAITFKMQDKGLSVVNGVFALKNGKIAFAGQPDKIQDLLISINVANDTLSIEQLKGKMGEGYFFIQNNFDSLEKSIILGNLNLGSFDFWTDDKGILLNFPGYMKKGSSANAKIKGLDGNKYAKLTGPSENLLIKAQIEISNADGMYPVNTDNLFNIFNAKYINKIKKRKKKSNLPIDIYLKLVFDKNIYYKTYPLNLLVEPGGYLIISHKRNDYWRVPEAKFSSNSGTIDVFSEIFRANQVNVTLSQTQKLFSANGIFVKNALDGALVTYRVFTKDVTSFKVIDNLGTELSTSNTDISGDLNIIASLKYVLDEEDINNSSRIYDLMRFQAMDLLGGAVQSTFLDPFLSPLESGMQRLLRLDLFKIRLNIVQNLFDEGTNQGEIINTDYSNPNVLFNKMRIVFGKSLTNRLFLISEINFQEPRTILESNKNLLIDEKIGFKYVFPYNFRFQYDYNILNSLEENFHEIYLKKSIIF